MNMNHKYKLVLTQQIMTSSILFLTSIIFQTYALCPGRKIQTSILNQQPKFISQVQHGARYLFSDPNNENLYINLAILEGAPYEMGFALGSLFRQELTESIQAWQEFIIENEIVLFDCLPRWIKNFNISDQEKFRFTLSFEQLATSPFLSQTVMEELKGISDGSNISTTDLITINLMLEIIRLEGSVIGIWGTASQTNNTIQLCSLDWGSSLTINDFSLITIYRPTQKDSQKYANFGWIGIIGSLNGYSENVGICYKSVSQQKSDMASQQGKPVSFILKEILEKATNLSTSMIILENSNRTFQFYSGFGSAQEEAYFGAEYSYSSLTTYGDQNFSFPFTPAHPQMNNILYWDNSAFQNSSCLSEIFETYYGDLNSEILYEEAAPLQKTGISLMLIYDFFNGDVFISYSNSYSKVPAYENSIFHLNMTYLFSLDISLNN